MKEKELIRITTIRSALSTILEYSESSLKLLEELRANGFEDTDGLRLLSTQFEAAKNIITGELRIRR